MSKPEAIEKLTAELDRLDEKVREAAWNRFKNVAAEIAAEADADDRPGNLHAHTFYSFNCNGYSPTSVALRAKLHGMEVAGIVDFDVLDGMDEFHRAGSQLNLRTVVSLETRVFVPALADRVINSPGEPGIAYHMAAGWVRPPASDMPTRFLRDLRERAARRNDEMIQRINSQLSTVAISYEDDVQPLTPRGNATERHISLAYARKAYSILGRDGALSYWREQLDPELPADALPETPRLLDLIRAKTMKLGGVGYVPPGPDTFPELSSFNDFARQSGALPMVAWLDGFSDGEAEMDEWFNNSGGVALNIIPARNIPPGGKGPKRDNLYAVMDWAEQHHWPVIAGTEMNSFGQPLVDDFDHEVLRPLSPVFQKGARIVYAHTALQRAGGFGYLGPWAEKFLPGRAERNAFFDELGARLTPRDEAKLSELTPGAHPEDLMRRIS